MAIDKEVIEQAKRTDLVALVQAKGIRLKKNGKSHMGLCPFHADKTPSLSVNPSKNLWQCFGCGAAGDAIRFVEMFDQVDFTEAVKRLNDKGFKHTEAKTAKAEQPKPLSVRDRKLLARVVEVYQCSFDEDKAGLDYLTNERNIKDLQSIKVFGAGYVNGTLKEILPEDPDVIKQLKQIGILNKKDNEIFYNCVVFPMYDTQGAVCGLYGRNIDPQAAAGHLYLAGPRTGLINRQAVKRSQTIFLTESIIDALTLYDAGFKNVIPIYGTNGLTDAHLDLMYKRTKTAYLVFDADPPGKKAARSVSTALKAKDITSYIVTLPDKDVNIYFNRHTPEQFEKLVKKADPTSCQQSENIQKRKQDQYKFTEHGFITGFGGRQYEIKGIGRGGTQLRVAIRASTDLAKPHIPFELTTIDLYSSKSRTWFAKLCAELFEADESLLKEDTARLLDLVENYQPQKKQEQPAPPTKAEKAAAMKLLKSKDMFKEILADLETMGVTGEQTNKLVGYLAAVSRKTDEPLSVLIQSRSAAGKSTLQDAVLSLVPDEDYVKYTRVTDQALFYKEKESLMHRILAIEEEVGMGGAAYSIRNIQSSKKITIATTGKDAKTGEMRTEEHEVLGPVAVMITTTAADLEGETASRFLFLTVDESTKMTAAIHAKQREAETLEGLVRQKKSEHIIKKHHSAQRLLRPLAVVNPFAQYLTYPDHSIRTRRDHKKYLGLIRTIAYLHQYQRKTKTVAVEGEPVEYIEVTLADIDKANTLSDEVLGHSLDELAPPSRTLLELILEMVTVMAKEKQCPINEVYFTRRRIREYTGWSDWQVREHIRQLEELEYLYARVGSKGKEYAYALNYNGRGQDDNRFYLNLTTVAQIRQRMKKDKGGRK